MNPPTSPNYGFVIDNRKCIGCHACSTACKSENDVPLGVYRTWVKYVETGAYPHNRRHFQVTRCNHCANPPCARICPVEAMYQRHDGIVEFDASVCIGCKACMQACPYDAIYIDPDSHTAAKCHYCAHRTDIGLEPACVVVCPEQAIIAGDMNDPQSQISQLLATEDVTVRKPEQGTAPKLFYIDGNDILLHPSAAPRPSESFMWADVIESPPPPAPSGHTGGQTTARNRLGAQMASPTIRTPQTQGQPWRGPIQISYRRAAEHMVQVGYNAQHHVPWHWPVPAYLVTKGIGAGLLILLSLGTGLGLFPLNGLTAIASSFTALLFIGLTTGLLVYDLERPERFLYILQRPQWKSWLTRGAFVLIGYSVLLVVWWLLETITYFAGAAGFMAAVRPFLLWLGLPLAILTAIYTAFLFAQAEGRDLWQSPLLPLHFLLHALIAGAGALLVLGLFLPLGTALMRTTLITLIAVLLLDLFVILAGEFGIPHASDTAAQAAHAIRHGRYRHHFWWGGLAIGHIAPLALGFVLLATPLPWLGLVAALCALAGLYFFEYAFVMAPQEIPNS